MKSIMGSSVVTLLQIIKHAGQRPTYQNDDKSPPSWLNFKQRQKIKQKILYKPWHTFLFSFFFISSFLVEKLNPKLLPMQPMRS